MNTCKYCHKDNVGKGDYCSSECKDKYEKYFDRWKTYKFMYTTIMILGLLLIIGQVILYPDFMTVSKIIIMIMGITMFVLPFGNTTHSYDVRKTILIVRVLSIFLIVLAIIFLLY